MATTVRRVEYFYVMAPDRPGEAARLLRHLAKAKVNLLAFSGFPAGRGAQIDFVPENPPAFRRVARAARWKLEGPKRAFLISGDDRAGALGTLLGKLAEAKINVTAVDAAAAGKGRWGAILWVKPKDARAAGRVLGAK
jgi:prephenate dehydratase